MCFSIYYFKTIFNFQNWPFKMMVMQPTLQVIITSISLQSRGDLSNVSLITAIHYATTDSVPAISLLSLGYATRFTKNDYANAIKTQAWFRTNLKSKFYTNIIPKFSFHPKAKICEKPEVYNFSQKPCLKIFRNISLIISSEAMNILKLYVYKACNLANPFKAIIKSNS